MEEAVATVKTMGDLTLTRVVTREGRRSSLGNQAIQPWEL